MGPTGKTIHYTNLDHQSLSSRSPGTSKTTLHKTRPPKSLSEAPILHGKTIRYN